MAAMIAAPWNASGPVRATEPVVENQVSVASVESCPSPEPTSTPTPVAEPRSLPTVVASPRKLFFYVPGEDGLLHRQELEEEYSAPYPGAATDEEYKALAAERALQLMLTQNASFFPSGTRLVGTQAADGTRTPGSAIRWDKTKSLAKVDLNGDFVQRDFWQGSTKTLIGIYAIVNSVAANLTKNDGGASVQILIDGKPINVIGEFYAYEPMAADLTLVSGN